MNREPTTESTLDQRIGRALFILALAVHLWCVHLGLRNEPVDGHEFRQTQTAISVRYLAEDGLRLDYPTPLLGRPWSIPLEFPLYQGIVAEVVRTTGLPIAPAGRLVGLLFFYLTLPGIYLLAGRLALPPTRRLLILAAILTSPLFLFYTRAVMIETTALCLCTWFLWAYWRALTGVGWSSAVAAVVCGALAAMVKLPTLVVFLVPAICILVWETRQALAAAATPATALKKIALSGLVVGLSLGAGLVWTAHADAVKALNPLASFLNSSLVGVWGMGPVNLRFSSVFWVSIYANISSAVLGLTGLVTVLLFSFLSPRPRRGLIWALLSSFATGPLIFSNLYQLHDYYFIASAIFLLAAFGLALGRVLELPFLPRPARWIVVTGLLSIGVVTYAHTLYRLIPDNQSRVPQLSRALKAVTKPDEVLVIFGQDWNPVLPYTSERRALMIPPGFEENLAGQLEAYARLGTDRVGALVVTGRLRGNRTTLQPVITRFGLTPLPVFAGQTTEVYVREANATAGISALLSLDLSDYHVLTQGRWLEVGQMSEPARKIFAMMTPQPTAVVAEQGLGLLLLDGRQVFSAHPVAQLVFAVPPGARRLRVGFGLVPGAYADPQKGTDGVFFQALLRRPDGTTEVVLAERLLEPATRAADRGPQEFDVALPAGATGEIILNTGPGPANNFAFDWAYLSSVLIE